MKDFDPMKAVSAYWIYAPVFWSDTYVAGYHSDVAHSWAWRCALDQGMRPADIVRAEISRCPWGYDECWDGCAYPGRCGGPR